MNYRRCLIRIRYPEVTLRFRRKSDLDDTVFHPCWVTGDRPGRNGVFQTLPRAHVECPSMPRALHDVSFQCPFPKWPPGVRARILQRQDFSIHVAECHIALSFDFKRPACSGFNLADMCHVNIAHHDHLDSGEPERTSVVWLPQAMNSGCCVVVVPGAIYTLKIRRDSCAALGGAC